MARKNLFHYNHETLTYEKIETTVASVIKKVLVHLLSSASLGIVFFLIYTSLIESPNEKELHKENARMHIQYNLLNRKMDDLQKIMTDLQQRDDNLYRVIFQAEPIPAEIRRSSLSNTNKYAELSDMSNSSIMIDATRRLDDLSKQIYIQSRSYDEIIKLSSENEKKLQHIPAIQPVLNRDLRRVASGFGRRIDPVYRTIRMHNGMDFTAPTGTDIFATGNGTVELAKWQQGYGNTVVINHGFGYKTLYAHMYKIKAKAGQTVTRGDVIGAVGNTGKSTGPHLHYEVRFQGKPVNPQNYYFLDLTPEQYDEMIQLSENAGKVFD